LSVCFGLRRRQIKKIGGGGGWVFGVFEFLRVYAAAAADQNRSVAAVARCGFSGCGCFGGGGGRSHY
jgi:hypothetical protein